MAIGAYPNNIQNGQLEDATPLMANFNYILNQINATLNPIGTFTAPSGTRMLFNQAAPPVGWTQEVGAAFNDCSVRTVGTAGGGTGGVTAWSGWNLGGTFSANAFNMTVAQMPAHTHVDAGHSHAITDPGHAHGSPNGAGLWQGNGQSTLNVLSSNTGGGGFGVASTNSSTASANTGIIIQNGTANLGNTGSGNAITPTYTTALVKYTDYVIGIKT